MTCSHSPIKVSSGKFYRPKRRDSGYVFEETGTRHEFNSDFDVTSASIITLPWTGMNHVKYDDVEGWSIYAEGILFKNNNLLSPTTEILGL